jgi:hypothetical protein
VVRRLVLGFALATAITGCGGDDSTETVTVGSAGTPEPLSKAEYIEQADAICIETGEIGDETDRRLDAAGRDYQAAADAIEDGLEQVRPRFDELNSLPKPEGDEAVLGEVEDTRAQSLALFARLGDAMRDEDDSRISSLTDELVSLDDRLSGLTRGYGFQECGQD